jgi:hypothetical protein
MDRRQAVQVAAAAAVALPLAANAYCDNAGVKCTTDQINKNAAPIITVFDHRGCAEHVNKEYTGPKAGNENDEMSIKVKPWIHVKPADERCERIHPALPNSPRVANRIILGLSPTT